MPRWLLGPQEGSVWKGTGWYQGQERTWHTFGFAVQDGHKSSLWKGDLRDQGGVTQDRMLSPHHHHVQIWTQLITEVWLATAAQGVSFHIRHLFSFHKKPTGNSVAVFKMGRVVWKGLFGLLGSAVGSNGIRGQQLWEGWPRASGLELLEALVFSCFSPDFSWPSDTCFLVQEHHPCS